VSVTRPPTSQTTQVRTVTIPLNVYLQSSTRILTIARVFGWQVIPATLDTHKGLAVRFDPLPARPPFPGVTYTLERITLSFGAARVIRKRVRAHGGTRMTRPHVYLINNPARCTGSWLSSVLLTFRDGTTAPLATPTTCVKS
jgi:hypothetical protein